MDQTLLSTRICQKCGYIPSEDRYCPRCGEELKKPAKFIESGSIGYAVCVLDIWLIGIFSNRTKAQSYIDELEKDPSYWYRPYILEIKVDEPISEDEE